MGYYEVMVKLNIHEIKSQFSKYIELVEGGETVVVCKRNVPVAEIRAIEKKEKRAPLLGSAAGTFKIPPAFYEPMSAAELAGWEGISGADPLKELAPKSRKRKK